MRQKTDCKINGLHCSERDFGFFFSFLQFPPTRHAGPSFRLVHSSSVSAFIRSACDRKCLDRQIGGQMPERVYLCACADEQKQHVSPYNIKHLSSRCVCGKCEFQRSCRQQRPNRASWQNSRRTANGSTGHTTASQKTKLNEIYKME